MSVGDASSRALASSVLHIELLSAASIRPESVGVIFGRVYRDLVKVVVAICLV